MYPNKAQAVGLTFYLVMCQFALSISLGLLGLYDVLSPGLIYILVFGISTTLVVQLASTFTGLRFIQLFHSGRFTLVSLLTTLSLPIVAATFGLFILATNIANLQIYFLGGNEDTAFLEKILASGLAGIIVICVIAPVLEEVVFRGILLRGLLSHLDTWNAIVFSAILFSLVHLDPDQLLYTLVIGCFLGWLYAHTYSLWPSIFAHVVYNGIAISGYLIETPVSGINETATDSLLLAPFYLQVSALLALVWGIYALSIGYKRLQSPKI